MKKSWIDAHHHLWLYNKAEYEWIKPDMVGINRDYIINDLESGELPSRASPRPPCTDDHNPDFRGYWEVDSGSAWGPRQL